MATSPAPELQVPIDHVGRLLGALVNPVATFADIARRPSWVGPIVVLTILSLGISVLLNQKVNWNRVVLQQIEQSPRAADMPPDQKQMAAERGAKVSRVIVYVFGVIGPALFALFLTAIYLGAFNLLAGAGVRFGTAFGIGTHALMPSAVGNLLGIVILFLKDPEAIDPQRLVAANLGVLVSSEAPQWRVKLAESFDLFILWMLFLLALGFAAASPKKVSRGRALGIVFGLWGVFVLVRVGWAAL